MAAPPAGTPATTTACASFRLLNAVRDALGLVSALGYRSVAAVVGHDFGSPVAAWCALVRPDVFRSVALMSAPFAGPPALPFDTLRTSATARRRPTSTPRSRNWIARASTTNGTIRRRPANADMWHCPQGVHAFLRAYYHHKSADWRQNRPFKLRGWIAEELAKMPTYYIMDLHEDMPATVAHEMPSAAEIAACRWLPDDELRVYSGEYQRTGFQGGLQLVSPRHRRARHRGTATVLRSQHRRAGDLHRRQQRLGRLPESRRRRTHAAERLHALPSAAT